MLILPNFYHDQISRLNIHSAGGLLSLFKSILGLGFSGLTQAVTLYKGFCGSRGNSVKTDKLPQLMSQLRQGHFKQMTKNWKMKKKNLYLKLGSENRSCKVHA